MARPKTIIQQKITALRNQVTHFEQCIQTAKQHIQTLENALIALESDPFQPQKKKPKEEPFISTITMAIVQVNLLPRYLNVSQINGYRLRKLC